MLTIFTKLGGKKQQPQPVFQYATGGSTVLPPTFTPTVTPFLPLAPHQALALLVKLSKLSLDSRKTVCWLKGQ